MWYIEFTYEKYCCCVVEQDMSTLDFMARHVASVEDLKVLTT